MRPLWAGESTNGAGGDGCVSVQVTKGGMPKRTECRLWVVVWVIGVGSSARQRQMGEVWLLLY